MDVEEMGVIMKVHADSLEQSAELRLTQPWPEDKNCLSYWFPRLSNAGVPVPITEIIHASRQEVRDLWNVFDGKPIGSFGLELITRVEQACDRFGYPCFLRTGQTSNKHDWKNNCFVTERESIRDRIIRLVEFSEMCDFVGLLTNVWVVREMLPTKPLATLPRYGNFPLVPEVRCFVKSGNVICHHPYWPQDSIEAGYERHVDQELSAMLFRESVRCVYDAQSEWMPLAKNVAKAFADDESFSVDLLPTLNGWHVTDMAIAARSFHWPDCKNRCQ